MHKFLIYLSIYFCLTCFGLSFNPSSEAGVQLRQSWVWFQFPDADTIPRRLEPLPNLYTCLWRWAYQTYEELVTPWRWQLPAETRQGNLMSIIKAYNTLERLFVILHRKIQKSSVQLSRWVVIICTWWYCYYFAHIPCFLYISVICSTFRKFALILPSADVFSSHILTSQF
jgi:hypothetical protein